MEDQQPPAEGERRGRDPAEQVLVDNQQQTGSAPDASYPRSLEGILKMISVPVALIGVILAAFGETAGIFFIFVGIAFIIYVGVVFIVEVFVPGIYIHRLVDSIISVVFCTLWLVAAIISTVYGSQWDIPALQGAAFCGYVLVLLCGASAFCAYRTWIKIGKGSLSIII